MKWRSLEESNAIDIRPLREIYAQRKALIEKYVPTETQDVHARVVNELKARGLAAQALAVRKTAPVFDLKDHNGKSVSSAALLAKGRRGMFFIRGRWCPFCVGRAEGFT